MKRGLQFSFLNILAVNLVLLGIGYLIAPRFMADGVRRLVESIQDDPPEQYILYFALLAACFIVEIVFLGWNQCALRNLLRPSQSAQTDLVVGGLHFLGLSGITAIFFTFGSAYVIPAVIKDFFGRGLIQSIPSHIVQFLIYFMAFDFLEYCHHRLSHKISFLWEAHKFHHSATEFNLLTGNRIHPLETGTRMIFTAVPLALLGAPVEAYITLIAIKKAIDISQHSMLDWRYGWIGDWVIYSPVGHRIHHSAMDEHHDRNFGNILPIWDRLFGTWYDGTVVNAEVDVTNNHYNQDTVAGDFIKCFRLAFAALKDSFRTGRWCQPSAPSPSQAVMEPLDETGRS